MSPQADKEIVVGRLKVVAARDGGIKSLLDHTRWSPGEHRGPVLVMGPKGTYICGISLELWAAIMSSANKLMSDSWRGSPYSCRTTHPHHSTPPFWRPCHTWFHFDGFDPLKLAIFVISKLQEQPLPA